MMMKRTSTIETIYKLNRLVFTTREIASMRGASVSSTTQSLSNLASKGIVKKIIQGLWGMTNDERFSQFLIIPFLAPSHRSYLSFTSALHAHGIIGQIPQIVTVATTAHSKLVRTSVGTFELHQIAPDFFDGFEWSSRQDYLIATKEKALVDCLYLASRRKRSFANFPELDKKLLGKKPCFEWIQKIRNPRIRKSVNSRLMMIF